MMKDCANCGPKEDDGGDATRCHQCWTNAQIHAAMREFLKLGEENER